MCGSNEGVSFGCGCVCAYGFAWGWEDERVYMHVCVCVSQRSALEPVPLQKLLTLCLEREAHTSN